MRSLRIAHPFGSPGCWMGYEKMKNWPNKAAPPNRRPRFAFTMSWKFDYLFYAPPSLSAAVGEPQRFGAKMIQPPCKIPYRPRWTVVVGSGVFFAVCALVIAQEAATNDRGLILEGIFRFSPHGATVFYWVLAGLSALFVLAALFLAVARLSTDRYLQLESDALILPHGFLQTKLSTNFNKYTNV